MRQSPFDGWVKADAPLEELYPRNNENAFVVAAATAWAWGAWAEIVAAASMSAAFVPIGAHYLFRSVILATGQIAFAIELEFGTGAAGARHAFALGANNAIAGANPNIFASATLPVGPTIIPSGTRIAARSRKSIVTTGGASLVVGTYLTGYDNAKAPVGYAPYARRAHLLGVHRAQTITTPSGSLLAATSGAAWGTYGAWVTVIDPAPSDLIVWGASRYSRPGNGGNLGFYMEFGSGPTGGTPQPRARMAFPGATNGQPGAQWLIYPVFVRKGDKFAVRVTAGGALTDDFMIFYEEV